MNMAGIQGFEPRLTESKSVVLPDYTISQHQEYTAIIESICSENGSGQLFKVLLMVVEDKRIELLTPGCKPDVIPFHQSPIIT